MASHKNRRKNHNNRFDASKKGLHITYEDVARAGTRDVTLSYYAPDSGTMKIRMQLVDLHAHIAGGDATIKFDELLKLCKNNNVVMVAPVQHNDLSFWRSYYREHGYDPRRPMINVDGINIIPSVEVTCVDPTTKNVDGNPVKMHLVVHAPDLSDDSPLVKLLQLKAENDRMVDYGRVIEVAKRLNIQLDPETIVSWVANERDKGSDINGIGKKQLVRFFSECVHVQVSNKRLLRLWDKVPAVERLQLTNEEVIAVAHASGGLVTFAHPRENLKTERTPEGYQTMLHFLKLGGDGIEAVNNQKLNPDLLRMICKAVQDSGREGRVYYSGGSDIHRYRQTCQLDANGRIPKDTVSVGVTAGGAIPKSILEQGGLGKALIALAECREKGKLSVIDYSGDRKLVETVLHSVEVRAQQCKAKFDAYLERMAASETEQTLTEYVEEAVKKTDQDAAREQLEATGRYPRGPSASDQDEAYRHIYGPTYRQSTAHQAPSTQDEVTSVVVDTATITPDANTTSIDTPAIDTDVLTGGDDGGMDPM